MPWLAGRRGTSCRFWRLSLLLYLGCPPPCCTTPWTTRSQPSEARREKLSRPSLPPSCRKGRVLDAGGGHGCPEGAPSGWAATEAQAPSGPRLEAAQGPIGSDCLCRLKCGARRQAGQTLVKVAAGSLVRFLLPLPAKQFHILREHNFILCYFFFFLSWLAVCHKLYIVPLLLNRWDFKYKPSSKVIENSRILGPMTCQAWFSSKQR